MPSSQTAVPSVPCQSAPRRSRSRRSVSRVSPRHGRQSSGGRSTPRAGARAGRCRGRPGRGPRARTTAVSRRRTVQSPPARAPRGRVYRAPPWRRHCGTQSRHPRRPPVWPVGSRRETGLSCCPDRRPAAGRTPGCRCRSRRRPEPRTAPRHGRVRRPLSPHGPETCRSLRATSPRSRRVSSCPPRGDRAV